MKKIFSIFAALLFAGSMMAEHKSEVFDFSDGYKAITVTTAGTSSTGSDYEFSKGDITVTGTKGYIKSGSHSVYKSGTMVVSAGGATIDSVHVKYNSGCFPFKDVAPSNLTDKGKTSAIVTVSYVPTTAVETVTFTNASGGKTELQGLTVYYTPAPTAPLTAITISIPEDVTIKKEYIVKESFDVTGIKAIATYDGAPEEDVTEDVTWTLAPETFESVAENASVMVQASIGEMKSNKLEITGITVRNLYTYTITWLDKNETFKTTTVTEGDALVLPATNPTCETKEFVGWTALETIPENATIEEMAFIDETTIPVADATYRAVFAKATKGESKSVELTHSSFELSGSYAKKTATVGEIGFIIDQGYKGTAVNGINPIQMNSDRGNGILYNTTAISGLESITLNVASGTKVTTIYQGTAQQPSTNEAGKTGETATISFAKGMTYFCLKVSGATYFSSIVINYTPVAYSEFSFTCPSTPSDIESISVPATSVLKTIENGQLVIVRDGVKYNAMGVRLQ